MVTWSSWKKSHVSPRLLPLFQPLERLVCSFRILAKSEFQVHVQEPHQDQQVPQPPDQPAKMIPIGFVRCLSQIQINYLCSNKIILGLPKPWKLALKNSLKYLK